MGILVPEVESYLEGFMCKNIHLHYLCSLGEISEKKKPCWKWENMVTSFYIEQKVA